MLFVKDQEELLRNKADYLLMNCPEFRAIFIEDLLNKLNEHPELMSEFNNKFDELVGQI